MQDRPSYDELLSAVEGFLTGLVTDLEGSRSFHARVAARAVALVRRELEHEDDALSAEWTGLDNLLGPQEMPADRAALRSALSARNDSLCDRIRSGAFDDAEESPRAFEHVRTTVRNKLIVSDPALLQR